MLNMRLLAISFAILITSCSGYNQHDQTLSSQLPIGSAGSSLDQESMFNIGAVLSSPDNIVFFLHVSQLVWTLISKCCVAFV